MTCFGYVFRFPYHLIMLRFSISVIGLNVYKQALGTSLTIQRVSVFRLEGKLHHRKHITERRGKLNVIKAVAPLPRLKHDKHRNQGSN